MRLRTVVCILGSSALLLAQQPAQKGGAAAPAPKNLKVLTADASLMDTMRAFNEALGVECDYCHTPGDFSSDANPRKETARKMIAMVRQVETYFPTTGGAFPRGYHEVDCSTCHLGSVKPETKAALHFLNRGDAAGNIPPAAKATNLKVLPADTEVHGKGSIMEDFRDALQVDCAYCHTPGGEAGFAKDDNPRKQLTRRMLVMTQEINANFPGTGVYPAGPLLVTCYTCHRGTTHPASLSNKNYPPAAGVR